MTEPEATTPPMSTAPARRATDLPPDAPWWARWIEANAVEAWKWASVQLPIAYSAFLLYYATNQEKVHQWIQANIPAKYWPWIGIFACVVQIVARIVSLKKKGTP